MRRLLASVVSTVLITAIVWLPSAAGAAGTPERFKYRSTGLSASWEQRHAISADSYERVRWYVDGYLRHEGTEQRFTAYVSRYQYLCKRRQSDPDRFRCSLVSRMTAVERDLSDVTFSVDRELDAGTLAGDFRLRQVENHEVVAVKRVHISTTLAGRGDVYRQTESYTVWDGTCPEARYRFEYRYRRASATLSMTGDFTAELSDARRASMSDSDGFVIRRDCG
jgi:hypothetical protein